jgi:hypothetical protein
MPIDSRRILLGSALLLAACTTGGDAVADSAIALGPGDAVITSANGGVNLMLVGDQIIVGLSDSVLHRVRSETDTSALAGQEGFGASVEKFVKSKVQNVLAKRIAYPLTNLEDVRFENGAIDFVYRGDDEYTLIENTKLDEIPLLASFPDSSAEAFVAAVKRRLTATGA